VSIGPSADSPARFRLLASAIAGRSVDVAAAGADAPAWTDGATIFIDTTRHADEQIRSLAVQASLLEGGSLDAALLAPLARRPSLARRYLSIEGHRALAGRHGLLPLSVRSVVDDAIAGRSDSPAASLAIAMSAAELGDPPAIFGMIRPRQVLSSASACRPADDGVPARHAPRTEPAVPPAVLDDEEEGALEGADLFSSPVGGGGGIGRLLKNLFTDSRSPGSGPPGAGSPTRTSRRATRVAPSHAVSTAVARIPEGTPAFAPRRFTYPEWDGIRGRYRPAWCTVTESVPRPEDAAPLPVPDTLPLRRSLGRLGTELERRHRQLQGDDVDIDAAVEARVEALAGSAPDEGVYLDNLRRRRDLSVLVLLDVSGSAGLPGAMGVPVHEHQRSAAAALSMALFELGDRVALYAFRSQGRSAVHLVPVKRFADQMDASVLQRLGGFAPGAYTRLGAAIRHGAAVLEGDGGTARRLLVVLSDGLAYDHGYESAYGEADARRALAEARRHGIGCLCLSIGAGADAAALRRVFGTAAHASIARGEHLPAVVGALFRSALRSAELRRRSWQRRARTKERLVVERSTA